MSEEEVLEELETIKSALLGTAHRFFSCYADCEDAVQECFYKAWRGRETIQNPEYFKTWATRILVNECKTMLRKKVPIPMEEMCIRDRLYLIASHGFYELNQCRWFLPAIGYR